ncbi:unnamed protein product [Ectocarpus sp. 13 AM-2016]
MAAEMSDLEGFEMLDETFGVREASEASDSETCPNSPLQLDRAGSLDNDGQHHLHSCEGGMAAGGRPAKCHATQAPGEGTVPETEKGKQPSASPIMRGKRGVGWTSEPRKGGAAGDMASLQARAEGREVLMPTKEVPEAAPAATLTFGDFPAISTAESSHSAGVSFQAPSARDQPARPEATSAASFGSQREAASPPPTSSAAFPAHHHPPVPRTTPPATTTAGAAAAAAAAARATPSVMPPAALAFGHESDGPDSYGSASPAAAAADEEAIVELVGMGFDREHVVRALKECGRGESWKEAAISLLLEPQVSSLADAEEGLSGTGRQGAAAMQGYADAAPAASQSPCPVCFEDIQAGEVFTVDCKEQHTFCVDCLHHHCRVQLLDSALIPACPLSTMKCGHELGQEEVERVSGFGNARHTRGRKARLQYPPPPNRRRWTRKVSGGSRRKSRRC